MNDRRLFRWILIALAIIVATSLLALPAAALWMPESMLNKLSDLGQAYGALSAFLSALALAAVAISVNLQARQRAADARGTGRTFHAEMFKIVMEEPEVFAPCIGNFLEHLSPNEYRQYCFTTMWLNYFRATHGDGASMSRGMRSEVFATMFASEAARKLWRIRTGEMQLTYESWDSVGPFYAMANSEYEKALIDGGNDLGPAIREAMQRTPKAPTPATDGHPRLT